MKIDNACVRAKRRYANQAKLRYLDGWMGAEMWRVDDKENVGEEVVRIASIAPGGIVSYRIVISGKREA